MSQRLKLAGATQKERLLWGQPSWIWVESLLIPLLGLALAWWAHSDNPFGLDKHFPWLWIAPLLVSLRYGVLAGLASSMVLLLAWLLIGHEQPFPAPYFLGGFILVMITGEYSGLWRLRMRRIEELNLYLDERIEQLARRHHLLRLSHERLEQSLISKPVTLRDALVKLSDMLREDKSQDPLPAAQHCLDFLAQICQFESAAILQVQNDQVLEKPVASVGQDTDWPVDDPLLQFACKRRRICHVRTSATGVISSSLLIALPLVTGSGQLRGVVVVRQMPFFALNDDTLQMMAALGSYYAEQISVQEIAAPMLEIMPDCPPSFAFETFKLQRVQRETGLSSAIIILVFQAGPMQGRMFDTVQRAQRSHDMVWPIRSGDRRILVTLMPLSSMTAVEGYLARIENMIFTRFGVDFAKARILHNQVDLGSPGGLLILQDVLRQNRE